MLIRVTSVQVCDVRDDAINTIADNKK